ncbi:MAG: cisplatin damage response ATP-dependent DNA ligase [Hyphomicrobiaceae bacterium]
MRAFARLLDDLANTPRRNEKLALMSAYWRAAPDPDRGWALAALTDGVPLRLPLRRILLDLMTERIDPELYRLSRDYVGDTAETVSLLWSDRHDAAEPPSVGEVIATLKTSARASYASVIAGHLDRLDVRERWAYLKLIGGAPRVGVSARLAKQSVADAFGLDVGAVEEVWHGLDPPYTDLFAWAEGRAERPQSSGRTLFLPMMLAVPLAEEEVEALPIGDFAVEWKWDGIRVQVAAASHQVRVFSRTGDDIGGAFPDVVDAFRGRSLVADGELLIARDGIVLPFGDLQQRLNRKSVQSALMRKYPAFVRLYDLLHLDGEDLRALPFSARRQRLEAWHGAAPPTATDLSPQLTVTSIGELQALRASARDAEIEGLMLKRRDSPYLAGRPKGHWFKWKRDTLRLDCVLMYAQRGSGKRSSFYSDYTFGVWRGEGEARTLVPIGKTYSGFTDEELSRLDKFVRHNTTEQFGPVRSVAPKLVLEIEFDAIHPSKRHKAGLAMRFPRVHRIRWDKPAQEADTLETAQALAH